MAVFANTSFQQYELTIQRAAREAAESSIEAHGHLVTPELAWEFIRDLWDTTEELELPDGMPPMFVTAYLAAGRVTQ